MMTIYVASRLKYAEVLLRIDFGGKIFCLGGSFAEGQRGSPRVTSGLCDAKNDLGDQWCEYKFGRWELQSGVVSAIMVLYVRSATYKGEI